MTEIKRNNNKLTINLPWTALAFFILRHASMTLAPLAARFTAVALPNPIITSVLYYLVIKKKLKRVY